jgi:hypothetical protein
MRGTGVAQWLPDRDDRFSRAHPGHRVGHAVAAHGNGLSGSGGGEVDFHGQDGRGPR